MPRVIKNKWAASHRKPRIAPLEVTALLYLQQAILKESYEECREIIEAAQSIGVLDFEIQDILEVPGRSIFDTS